jgi:hypothetical protein
MEVGAGETALKNGFYGCSGRLGDTKENQDLWRRKTREA